MPSSNARFPEQRRRAARRVAVVLARFGALASLGLCVAAVALLLVIGAPLLSTSTQPPAHATGRPGTSTAGTTTNGPLSLATDYLAALTGRSPAGRSSAPRHLLRPARFGAFAVQPVAAHIGGLDAVPAPSGPENFGLPAVAGGSVSPLPVLINTPATDRVGLGQIPPLAAEHLMARDEATTREAQLQRQIAFLDQFLSAERAREVASLTADEREARRLIEDEARSAAQLDLSPLEVDLPDAEIQLEMTNLRIKLGDNLSMRPEERAAASARLAQLEREWDARLDRARRERGDEMARLSAERPRQVREAGLARLDQQHRAALERGTQMRAQVAAPLREQLQSDTTAPPLGVILPAVPTDTIRTRGGLSEGLTRVPQ